MIAITATITVMKEITGTNQHVSEVFAIPVINTVHSEMTTENLCRPPKNRKYKQ